MSALDDALHYAQRGWAVIPVPFRSKNPGFKGWEQLRVTRETATKYFNGQPQNIGVLLGEPSGWLIDVDLDHLRAVELAAAVPARHAGHLRPLRQAPIALDLSRLRRRWRRRSSAASPPACSSSSVRPGCRRSFHPAPTNAAKRSAGTTRITSPPRSSLSHLLECVQTAGRRREGRTRREASPHPRRRSEPRRSRSHEPAATTQRRSGGPVRSMPGGDAANPHH